MKNILLFIFSLFISIFSKAQEKNLTALKIHAAIKIDGVLDESVWQEAAIADSFIVNSPNYGDQPRNRTIAKVLYDDQAVYIGAYLYDDPQKIRKQLTSRDGEGRQDIDYFSVFLIPIMTIKTVSSFW